MSAALSMSSLSRIPGAAVGQADVLSLLAMLQPRGMSTSHKIRLGASYDGGYVLPDAALECDALLSIGIGSDVSFDHALAERGMPVFQYDHTVEASPIKHERFRFNKLGWGPTTDGAFVSLATMMNTMLQAGSTRPLLKFDIEGGEYPVLEAIEADALEPFPVIVCELHGLSGLSDPAFHDRARHCIETLTRHHAPVHLHANNYGVMALVLGVPVPDVLEVSLLRRDLGLTGRASADAIPGLLDRPNHPLLPDLCLTPFMVGGV